MAKRSIIKLFSLAILLCSSFHNGQAQQSKANGISLVILGTVQDGGSPHIGCQKECCKDLFEHPDKNRKVVSLGVVDHEKNSKYLFEATPDMPEQMKMLKNFAKINSKETPDAIFLTHAHIGHYTGLMYLGKEAFNSKGVKVFAMPRMKDFLENNGPWSQLVTTNNIVISELAKDTPVRLSSNLKVIPFRVPHREEYSETVGYTIIGPNKKALFIPDIDKWKRWDRDIIKEISRVDYAFIDATFYDAEEVNYRDISEIPHPFIIESMSLFEDLAPKEKDKIYFIHLNHTNPALNQDSPQSEKIRKSGFHVAQIKDVFEL